MNFRNEIAVTQLSLDKSGERGRRLTNAVYAVAKRGFKTQGTKKSCWTSLTMREKPGTPPQSKGQFQV